MKALLHHSFLFIAGSLPLTCPAGIISSDETVILYSEPNTRAFYTLDFNGDGIDEFTFTSESAFFVGLRSEENTRYLGAIPPPPNIPGTVLALDTGFEIGRESENTDRIWSTSLGSYRTIALCLASGFETVCSNVFPPENQSAFIGIEFTLDDGVHYGYIEASVQTTLSSVNSMQIYGWAWETEPGKPITAVPIPEPITMIFFLLGGGFLWLAKKKELHSV